PPRPQPRRADPALPRTIDTEPHYISIDVKQHRRARGPRCAWHISQTHPPSIAGEPSHKKRGRGTRSRGMIAALGADEINSTTDSGFSSAAAQSASSTTAKSKMSREGKQQSCSAPWLNHLN